jgi:LysR family transcriptional activator of nhaA
MILLNHHHLYYFWTVAREGSVSKACEKLHLAQPTVSAQIIQFEKALGRQLFTRDRQRMVLTDDGRLVMDYANHIFGYTQELLDALHDRPTRQVLRVQLGIQDQTPEPAAHALLRSALDFRADVRPTVVVGSLAMLLHKLQQHSLDLILTNRDVPLEQAGDFERREVHRLPVHLVAAPALAKKLRGFPNKKEKVPVLMPSSASPLNPLIERYFAENQVEAQVVGEIQDRELLRLLALDGAGVAPLDSLSAKPDLKSRRLVSLTGSKTPFEEPIWVIAKKRHRLNPVAAELLRGFQLSK